MPFLMGSISASPFSSGALRFPSASGGGAGAEVKVGSRGTGLPLGGAGCMAASPVGGSAGPESALNEKADSQDSSGGLTGRVEII